ncbi:MAG: SCO family protein [Afipia sp.]|nr:SCO family protein [Afipia sp.]
MSDEPSDFRIRTGRIGNRGTRAGGRPRSFIDQVLKEYRIYSKKVPQDDGNYIMDHSASVYLFDKDGTFTSTLDYQEKPDVALAKLKRLIAEG